MKDRVYTNVNALWKWIVLSYLIRKVLCVVCIDAWWKDISYITGIINLISNTCILNPLFFYTIVLFIYVLFAQKSTTERYSPQNMVTFQALWDAILHPVGFTVNNNI